METALSIYLENFATTLGSREQLAIAEFANSLLIIPKTLASNAAKDTTDLVARLRAFHNTAQTDITRADMRFTGRLRLGYGVLAPAVRPTDTGRVPQAWIWWRG